MKKLLLPILFVAAPFFLNAQCTAQISFTPATCYGACDGTATATPSGGVPPYTYLWGPNGQTTQTVTMLCAGNYSCNVIDNNGCSSTQFFNITQPGQITLNYTQQPASCSNCQDGSATAIASGGALPYTYNWFPSGGTGVTETGLNPGTYSFTVTDANGCTVGMLFTVGNSNSVGIADQPATGILSVYPNPASGFVTVKETFANPVAAQIIVTNVLGETVFARSVPGAKELNETINMSGFTDGVYFISIITPTGKSVRKLIKE
jgi:hypothetical protein